jgi:tetratricopeptide (TPR) repeat protein
MFGGAANVARIFISYSSLHLDLTRALAAAIETKYGAGSVWWDQAGLRAGDRFSPEITRALDAAKAVVVVWTQGAATSDWVYAEAVRAASQRKIVTVRAADLDPKLIPLPFNVFHTCLAEDISALLDGIQKRLSGELSPLPAARPGQSFGSFVLGPKQVALPRRAIDTSPASLLLAKHRLVPFDDIHGLCDEFVRWATSDPALAMGRLALGRLVYAPAGLGKTRTLIEIADVLTREHGWLAGFVPRDVRGAGRELSEGALERLILGGGDAAGLMLIVDYADNRQNDVVWLADQVVRRAENISKPARLVLVSRGSGLWWRELVVRSQSLQDLCSLGRSTYDEVTIPEEIAPRRRRALFDASVTAFRTHANQSTADSRAFHSVSEDLARALECDDDYDRPLAVQIAALLHVAGVDTGGRHDLASLLDCILGLEYEYWGKALRIPDRSNLWSALKNGTALITLVGSTNGKQAVEGLIRRDPLFNDVKDIDVPRVYRDLSSLFPGENEGLVGLEPDLIGEHHVAGVVTDALVDASLDWAGEDRELRRRIVTVLNRATLPEHGTKADRAAVQLDRLLRARVAMLGGDLIKAAFETQGRLLELCLAAKIQVEELDETALTVIGNEIPMGSTVLGELGLQVARRLADLSRKSVAEADAAENGPPDMREQLTNYLAVRLANLGTRLSNLERREEALAATQEAVEIYRRLTQTRPDAHLPDLATILLNLGTDLSNLQRREEALAVTQEAVEMYRCLVQMEPDKYLSNLGKSLNNLGAMLAYLGRQEEGLAATQEAVEIARQLVQKESDEYLPELASNLHNLGRDLRDLGRRSEALAAMQESVEIYRRLAQTRPAVYLPELASNLDKLGRNLFEFGHREEAVAATEKAVEIYRRLAGRLPDEYLPDLATSLSHLGRRFWDIGQREAGLVATRESVEIYRRLTQTRPDAYLPDLATSLQNLGADLSDLGRLRGALAASQEAVEIGRRLVAARPDENLARLAMSLNSLGVNLANIGRREAGLVAMQESVEIYRRLAQTRPDAYRTELARSLNNLGVSLFKVGRLREARAVSQELEALLGHQKLDALLRDGEDE